MSSCDTTTPVSDFTPSARNSGTTIQFWPDKKFFDTDKFSVPQLKHVLKAKAVLFAAAAYFVMPVDMLPDVIAGLGFTDDATVLATAGEVTITLPSWSVNVLEFAAP